MVSKTPFDIYFIWHFLTYSPIVRRPPFKLLFTTDHFEVLYLKKPCSYFTKTSWMSLIFRKCVVTFFRSSKYLTKSTVLPHFPFLFPLLMRTHTHKKHPIVPNCSEWLQKLKMNLFANPKQTGEHSLFIGPGRVELAVSPPSMAWVLAYIFVGRSHSHTHTHS